MTKFFAIFTGAATDDEPESLTDEQSSAFLYERGAWARSLGSALVDPGMPLFKKIRLTAEGADPFEDGKTAYAIVEAPSHEDAVEHFRTHPHKIALIRQRSVVQVHLGPPILTRRSTPRVTDQRI